MSNIPDDLEALLQGIQNGTITMPPYQEPAPKIKPEDISDEDINTLLNEIETPKGEIAATRERTQLILSLTEEQATNGEHVALNKMIALTEDRAWYLPRFELIDMIYRDYVGIHSDRISYIIGFNRPLFKKIFGEYFDDHYLTLYAKIHDILEGLSPFGDIPTPLKLGLSQRSQEVMDIVERKLGEILITRIPLAHGEYEYDEAMLEDMITKRSLESQVLSYFDKVDGFITCFHELVAGNNDFLEPFGNYIAIFKDIKDGKKLPNLQQYFKWDGAGDTTGDLQALGDINSILIQEDRISAFFNSCPTDKSMEDNTSNDFGLPMYGVWKKFVKMMSIVHYTGMISGEELLCKRGREIIAPEGLY